MIRTRVERRRPESADRLRFPHGASRPRRHLRHVHAATRDRASPAPCSSTTTPTSPTYGGQPVDALDGRRSWAPCSTPPSCIGSPLFGVLSDRVGHRRVMLVGPAFGAIAVIITAFTVSLPVHRRSRGSSRAPSTAASVPSILGFIAFATAARRAPPGPGRRPVRGRDAGRADGRLRASRVRCSRCSGPRRFLLNAARVRRLVRDLPVRRPEARRARAGGPLPRPRGGPAALRPDPPRQPRLAARADVDRHQRDARPVHEPDAVPARPRARTRSSPTSS